MEEHYRQADTKIEQIAHLLYTTRFAREDGNLPWFRQVWSQVVNIWLDYLNQQLEFQSNVTLLISAINSTVQNGS